MASFLKSVSFYGIIAKVVALCVHLPSSELFVAVTNLCIPAFIILALYKFLRRKIEGEDAFGILFGELWFDFKMPIIDIHLLLTGHTRFAIVLRVIIFVLYFAFLVLGMFGII